MAELKDLSPEQREVVECWDQGLAVMAGAGSGKTTTLVVKCLELLQRHSEARFAAVSFTERSAGDLREKLALRLPHAGDLTRHWVMTIHGLCGAVIREYPRQAGFDGDEAMLSESESQLLWERATDGLWFEDLPEGRDLDLELLFSRESREGILLLLRRVRELHLLGVSRSLAEQEDPASRALERLGAYVLERYERLKRRRGALDFNDLERGADRALEHEEVRRAFHKRFDLVLIDEFQDTNPLQARILWRFARPDSSNLCVVGDPKQSIYRFRDADVTVFEDACRSLPRSLSLTWNFRSRPGIIDFSNQTCAQPFEESGLAYEPLVPKREVDPDPLAQPVIRLDVETPEDLCQFIQAERARGVKLEDMALLLRKVRGNEKWLKALSAAGIPLAVGSGGLFWEDPRVRELCSLLKWWDQPGNALSGAVFLRAPWVGVDDLTLDAWVREDATWEKPFFSSTHRLALLLKPLREKEARPGEIFQALLADPRVEAELGASVLGLWHRSEELSSRGLDFHSVVTELGLALEQSRRERDVPPPKNQGQLLVLTIHGSKGLEFPHVILVDLPVKPGRSPNSPALYWDRAKGAFLARKDADGERDDEDPEELLWKAEEIRKSVAESKRLFYVALTRARERLILVCEPEAPAKEVPVTSKSKSAPRPKKEINPFEKDFWRGWIEASGADIPRLVLEGARAARATEERAGAAGESRTVPRFHRAAPVALFRPRYSVTEWNVLNRCGRAYEWGFVRAVPVVEGVAQMGLFTGEKVARISATEISQQELGTRVHGCLERADFDGLKALESEVGEARFVAEPVISWALSSPYMAPPTTASSHSREVWTEFSFEVPVGGQVLVGSMDRLVLERTPLGSVYSIVDFKVTEKMKSVDALVEAYRGQLALYSRALEVLEPGSKGRIESVLINISPRTIQTVPVVVEGADLPERLAAEAAGIVAGEPGVPRPGPLCRVCEFRRMCPDALRV